jgi:hypothetical protein
MKPKKTSLQRQGFFFTLAFLLIGCADPASGTLTEIYKYPKELWGEWIRMDTGSAWYITSNYMEGNESSNTNLELKRQSGNVIEVTEEKRKYYLYASRIPNGSFSGTIVGDSSGRVGFGRSMTGMGGIGVTISNLNDAANEVNTSTDGNGNFTAEGTIPGDKYEITAGDQTTIVTPNTDGENIGNVTVTDGVNFKTSITPQSSIDMMKLYTDTSYSFNIEVENTGTEDCPAATYRLTVPSGLAVTGTLQDILGTIEPEKKKAIPITVTCDPIIEEFVYKTIELTITDIENKTWNDSVSLKFNREQVTFYIRSASTSTREISGVVIVPSAKAYYFKTGYNSYNDSDNSYSTQVTVPKYSNRDYLIIFSGATADTEAKYSLGVGVAADTNFSDFLDTGSYEPNNTEETARPIGSGGGIMSYLHKNDIDYYRVNLESIPQTPLVPDEGDKELPAGKGDDSGL